MQAQFEIYTDGSFKDRIGSWSYIILRNKKIFSEVSGRTRKTDSNRMEFQAAIEALKTLSPGSRATLYSDSRVLVENVPLFAKWHANAWKKKNNRPIPNVDLFKTLYKLILEREVSWEWVKAHSGNPFNERCDELCILAREN